MKDNKIAEIHNELRDIAVRCHAHKSLRLRIANILMPLVSELKELKLENEWLKAELELHKEGKL